MFGNLPAMVEGCFVGDLKKRRRGEKDACFGAAGVCVGVWCPDFWEYVLRGCRS